MSDTDAPVPEPIILKEVAVLGQEVGISNETAAFDGAAQNAPPSIDEGDPATKNDGSGTSETD